jgi:hypothetical protein
MPQILRVFQSALAYSFVPLRLLLPSQVHYCPKYKSYDPTNPLAEVKVIFWFICANFFILFSNPFKISVEKTSKDPQILQHLVYSTLINTNTNLQVKCLSTTMSNISIVWELKPLMAVTFQYSPKA